MSRLNHLMDLLNRYLVEEQGDMDQAARRLITEGYTPFEIDAAIEWQVEPEDMRLLEAAGNGRFRPGVRIFTSDEQHLLADSARAFVLESMFSGRLDPCHFEDVMDRLRGIQARDVDADDLRILLGAETPIPEEEREIRTRFSSIH